MKTIKLVILVLLLLTMAACNNREAKRYWQETVEARLQGQKYVNLRVEVDGYSVLKGKVFDSISTRTFDIHLTPGGLYIHDDFRYKLLTKDSLFIYHYNDGSFTYGNHTQVKTQFEKNIFDYLLSGWTRDLDELIPFYLTPEKNSSFVLDLFDMKYIGIDTVGDSVHVLRLASRWPWKEKAHDGSTIKSTANVGIWVDDATGMVSRVLRTVHCVNDSWGSEIDEITDLRILDILLEAPQLDESLYRKNPERDSSIEFYNINAGEVSPSDFGTWVSEDEADMDAFLDAPIVNTLFDTTTLRRSEGWVLVGFWMYGCRGCVRFMQSLQQEQESLGYRKLEREGVSIMCLNVISSMNEHFREYAKRFGMEDIVYSAKGIGETVSYENMPYYFLLSPEKDVVYQGISLGENYEEVLKAMEKYIRR